MTFESLRPSLDEVTEEDVMDITYQVKEDVQKDVVMSKFTVSALFAKC